MSTTGERDRGRDGSWWLLILAVTFVLTAFIAVSFAGHLGGASPAPPARAAPAR